LLTISESNGGYVAARGARAAGGAGRRIRSGGSPDAPFAAAFRKGLNEH